MEPSFFHLDRQVVGRFQGAVLHGPQHLGIGEHHAAAAQGTLQGQLQLLRLDAPVRFQDHLPGRVVQHPPPG